jgi:hypothetical protein
MIEPSESNAGNFEIAVEKLKGYKCLGNGEILAVLFQTRGKLCFLCSTNLFSLKYSEYIRIVTAV